MEARLRPVGTRRPSLDEDAALLPQRARPFSTDAIVERSVLRGEVKRLADVAGDAVDLEDDVRVSVHENVRRDGSSLAVVRSGVGWSSRPKTNLQRVNTVDTEREYLLLGHDGRPVALEVTEQGEVPAVARCRESRLWMPRTPAEPAVEAASRSPRFLLVSVVTFGFSLLILSSFGRISPPTNGLFRAREARGRRSSSLTDSDLRAIRRKAGGLGCDSHALAVACGVVARRGRGELVVVVAG
jgi:hypothetical protein